jgi:hypothetical protein
LNVLSPTDLVATVAEQGFAIIPNLISPDELESLLAGVSAMSAQMSQPAVGPALGRRGELAYGVRNLFNLLPGSRELANSAQLHSIVEPILGVNARVVRGIFFDKNTEANWKVPWHQDVVIAVQERVEMPGYGPWSVKAGVVHVQPPVAILENMLTVRIHLDDANPNNGALKVFPQSHLQGRLSADAIKTWQTTAHAVICEAKRGDVSVMHPLLLHASSMADTPSHRRVLHFEYAGVALPEPLRWREELQSSRAADHRH